MNPHEPKLGFLCTTPHYSPSTQNYYVHYKVEYGVFRAAGGLFIKMDQQFSTL